MKYILIFVANSHDDGMIFGRSVLPGSIYEVERFDSIELAVDFSKSLSREKGDFIIMPFYECS